MQVADASGVEEREKAVRERRATMVEMSVRREAGLKPYLSGSVAEGMFAKKCEFCDLLERRKLGLLTVP